MRPANTAAHKMGSERTWAVLRIVGRYLWPEGEVGLRCRVVVAGILLIAAKVANVYVPVVYKHAIDALGDPKMQAVAVPVALILAYGVARITAQAFGELRDALFAPVSQRAIRSLAMEVFRHLHALSLRFHLERQTGGLSRVIERGTTGMEFLIRFATFNILPTLFEILLVGIVMWGLYDWRFSAVTLVAIAGYIVFSISLSEWRIKFVRSMNDADTDANSKAIDSLLNYETVKYFNAEQREAERYDKSMARYERNSVASYTSLAVLNAGQAVIFTVGLTVVMWMCVAGIRSGRNTIGDFVLINAMMIQLYQPLNFMGMLYREVKQAVIDIETMFQLLNEHPEIELYDPDHSHANREGSYLAALVIYGALFHESPHGATRTFSAFEINARDAENLQTVADEVAVQMPAP